MKKKLRSMGRVAIALVLALSLVLVMEAPVSATHTSSAVIAFQEGASMVVGEASILDVKVTNDGSADSIYEVEIDFSASDFTVTGAGTDPTGWTGSGPTTAKVVTYTADAGYEIAPGVLLAVTFSPAVTNPATDGAATVPVVTTSDAGSKHILAASEATGWIGYIALEVDELPTIEYDLLVTAFPLSVSVDGVDITVNLANDGAGQSISTASEVAAKINAHAEASLLVDAAAATGHTDYAVQDSDVALSPGLAGGTGAGDDVSCGVIPGALTIIGTPFEVWVDDDGNDGNPGTELLPVATIAQGISIATAGGTVNVLPGTYSPGATTLYIGKAGLTLQSTGGAAVTIIDCDNGQHPTSHITASDVTVDGFTWDNSPQDCFWIQQGADDVTVQNNRFIDLGPGCGVVLEAQSGSVVVTRATISDNVFENCFTGPCVLAGATDCTISGNTITGCTDTATAITLRGGNTGYKTQGNTITGNTITNNVGSGIRLFPGLIAGSPNFFDDNLIEGNTISRNDKDGIEIDASLTITNLTITGNDITANTEDGITIGSTSWGATNAINYNNIYGNADGTNHDIENGSTSVVDAENNWWGQTGGPVAATQIYGPVDYSPWLNAEYGVEPVTTISLEVGWNFISVPKRMAAATDTFEELLTGITTGTSYSYDAATGTWSVLTNATPVEVLEGYWLDVTTAGTITPSYKEEGQAVPASKSLTGDAWNAIGFSSTTALDADTALMSIQDSWSTLIAWDAEGQAYEDSIIATGAGDMSPGKGYWIWMTEADVLSAVSG